MKAGNGVLVIVGVQLVLVGACCGGVRLFQKDEPPEPPIDTRPYEFQWPRGFSMSPLPGFAKHGYLEWQLVEREDTQTRTLNVRFLNPALRDEPQAVLDRLWSSMVAVAGPYEELAAPLQQRRFMPNGARACFMRKRVQRDANDLGQYISLYLIDAEDDFVVLIITQDITDTGVTTAKSIRDSWSKSHARVEKLLEGLNGYVTGAPLVAQREIVGRFARVDVPGVEYTFNDDGTFTYEGRQRLRVDDDKFTSQNDKGRWKIERDVLVIDGELIDRKYFIAGAGHRPNGARFLLLQPELNRSFDPQVESELFVLKP